MSTPRDRPAGEVKDYCCEACGALMILRWTGKFNRWFYGCKKFPECRNAFSANQQTGEPQPAVGRVGAYRKFAPKEPEATVWSELLKEDSF